LNGEKTNVSRRGQRRSSKRWLFHRSTIWPGW